MKKFRKKVRKMREEEWIRNSLLLRNKSCEESLKIMFDLSEFAEKINRVKK